MFLAKWENAEVSLKSSDDGVFLTNNQDNRQSPKQWWSLSEYVVLQNENL